MSKPLDAISGFKAIVSTSINIEVSPKDRKRIAEIAQKVLEEVRSPDHELSEKEVTDLLKFIYHMEIFAGKTDGSTENKTYQIALTQLKTYWSDALHQNPISQAAILAGRIQNCIGQLSVEDPHLREKVREIKQEINQLRELVSNPKHQQKLDFLSRALDALVFPEMCKISFSEFAIIGELCKQKKPDDEKFQERNLQLYAGFESESIAAAQKEILSRLQKVNEGGFKELTEKAFSLLQGVREQAIQDRLKRTHNISEDMIDKAPSWIETLERYTQTASAALTSRWQKAISHKNLAGLGASVEEVQAFLSHYPLFRNIDIPSLIQLTIEKILSGLPIKNGGGFVNTQLEKFKDLPQIYFIKEFKSLKPKLLFLAKRREHITAPYSQTLHVDTKLGGGVCFSSALERHAALIENPNAELQPGSTQTSRFHQNIYEHSDPSLLATELKIAQAYHLKPDSFLYLALPEAGNLLNEISLIIKLLKEALATATGNTKKVMELQLKNEEERKKAILGNLQEVESRIEISQAVVDFSAKFKAILLTLESDTGKHAMNIQVDSENEIFRIVDDNLGVLSFRTKEALEETLAELLEIWYPEHKLFGMRAYTKT